MATDKLFHKLAITHAAAILKLLKIPDYNDYQASSFTKQFTGNLRTVVMFLEESHYHAAAKLAHHFDGSSELAFQPTIFVFSEKNVAELENLNDVRLIPLYPLCNISPEQIKAAATKWAERIKTAPELEEKKPS